MQKIYYSRSYCHYYCSSFIENSFSRKTAICTHNFHLYCDIIYWAQRSDVQHVFINDWPMTGGRNNEKQWHSHWKTTHRINADSFHIDCCRRRIFFIDYLVQLQRSVQRYIIRLSVVRRRARRQHQFSRFPKEDSCRAPEYVRRLFRNDSHAPVWCAQLTQPSDDVIVTWPLPQFVWPRLTSDQTSERQPEVEPSRMFLHRSTPGALYFRRKLRRRLWR